MNVNKSMYLEKIKYIDEMLDSDELLNEYVSDIENNKFDVPSNIEEIIKINNQKLDKSKKNNYKYLNILKVACFTLVVMFIWNTMTNMSFVSATNSKFGINEDIVDLEKENKIYKIYGKVNEFTNMFSSVLLNPVEFEGGER